MKNFCFRPLSGFCISKYNGRILESEYLEMVSVPYRGSVFLNTWINPYKVRNYSSFRPLSGFCISKCCEADEVIKAFIEFPSPIVVLYF